MTNLHNIIQLCALFKINTTTVVFQCNFVQFLEIITSTVVFKWKLGHFHQILIATVVFHMGLWVFSIKIPTPHSYFLKGNFSSFLRSQPSQLFFTCKFEQFLEMKTATFFGELQAQVQNYNQPLQLFFIWKFEQFFEITIVTVIFDI